MVMYLISLSLAHLGWLGPIRYAIIGTIIASILVFEQKAFISKSYAYNIGFALLFAGGLFASVSMNVAMSYSYVLFMLISFLIYPGFTRYKLPRRYVIYIAAYLTITILHVLLLGAGGRENNWYGNANNYASIILCAAYFCLLAFHKRPLQQLLTTPIILYLMVFSQSRTQLAGLLMFYGLYFLQTYVLRIHLRRTIFFVIIGMFALYGTLISGDPFNIIGVVQENTVGHKSYRGLSYRDVLFFFSIDIIDRYPGGVGWSESGVYIYEYMGEKLSPHNTYMKVAVEGGIAALVGFLVMQLGLLWKTRSPLVSSFMICMILRALFESSTPMTLSLVSAMLILPFFLNENSIIPDWKVKRKLLLEPIPENRLSLP